MNGTDAPPAEQAPPAEAPPPEEKKPDEPALGDSLEVLAKKLFFVAEGAGEPVLGHHPPYTIVLSWPDDSIVRVGFEVRPGRHHALGPQSTTEEETQKRNEAFQEAKKLEEDRKAGAAPAA